MINKNVLKLIYDLKIYSPITYGHSIAVAYHSVSFGRMLGLDEECIQKLMIAGLLHDIGKLMIPITILNKSGKLTEDEYDIIKKHPLYSVYLLTKAGFKNEEVLKMILSHHERLNGLGYPYGISEEDIPELTKIITICDCYDAMKSKRSYKEARNIDYIKKELLINSGGQFDSYYVDTFLTYLSAKDRNRINNKMHYAR